MSLWLRVRRVSHLCVVVVLVGPLQVVLGGRVLLTPTIVGTDAVSAWSMFLPVMVGVAAADALAGKTQAVEQHVTPRVVVLDVALLVSIVVTASSVLAAAGGTHPALAGTVGQVAIATGSAAVVTMRWGAGPGAMTPIAMAVVCFGYGSDAPARAYVRVLGPDSNPWWDLVVGLGLVGIAIVLVATRSARVRIGGSDRLVD